MTINAAALASAENTERELALITYPSSQLDAAKVRANECTLAIGLIPQPTRNAEFYGAKGDGKTNDTAALQKMADTGEMVFDQPGKTYLIDYSGVQITKRTKMRVEAAGVVFRMIPNSQSRYYVFRLRSTASDCDMDFGSAQISGDRDQHNYTSGSTHEHGYGIFVSGARNRVYSSIGMPADANKRGANQGGAFITGCTGDGMGTAGHGHEIFGFTFDFCRRQGISAFEGTDQDIHHNTIRNIGNAGAQDPAGLIGPFACIDAEPDQGMGDVRNMRIHHNRLETSRTAITVWVRSEVTSKIDCLIYDNDIIGQSNGVWTKDAKKDRAYLAITVTLQRNYCLNNKNHDFRIDQGTKATIGGPSKNMDTANTFDDLRDRSDAWRQGVVSPETGKYANAQVVPGLWNFYA